MSDDITDWLERPACKIDWCPEPRYCRGWCRRHYNRWYTTGDPLSVDGRTTQRKYTKCAIAICIEPVVARGWCQKHYYNWSYHGDPEWTIPPRPCLRCSNEFTPLKDTRKQICEKCKISTETLSRALELHLPKGQYIAIIQDKVCAICERGPEDGWQMVVDHDHNTGVIREPLCGNHNSGIGFFDDDPELLRRAADYIEYHRSLQPEYYK